METGSAEREWVLADHLKELVVRRLVDPLEILLGGSGDLRAEVAAKARAWAAEMLGEDDRAAAHTAIRIVAALHPVTPHSIRRRSGGARRWGRW